MQKRKLIPFNIQKIEHTQRDTLNVEKITYNQSLAKASKIVKAKSLELANLKESSQKLKSSPCLYTSNGINQPKLI